MSRDRLDHPERVPLYRARMIRDHFARYGTWTEYQVAQRWVRDLEAGRVYDPLFSSTHSKYGNISERFA